MKTPQNYFTEMEVSKEWGEQDRFEHLLTIVSDAIHDRDLSRAQTKEVLEVIAEEL